MSYHIWGISSGGQGVNWTDMNTCNMQISIEREADGSFVKTGQETEETAPPPKKRQEQKGERKVMQLPLSKNSVWGIIIFVIIL